MDELGKSRSARNLNDVRLVTPKSGSRDLGGIKQRSPRGSVKEKETGSKDEFDFDERTRPRRDSDEFGFEKVGSGLGLE